MKGTLSERMARFTNRGEPDDCWEWTGAKAGRGYGKIFRNGRLENAHHLVLAAKLGRNLTPGMFACHHCDNPSCVNPEHLFEGTASDNMLDASAKGRVRGFERDLYRPAGERNVKAKLTASAVDKIRECRSQGATLKLLAEEYGVTKENISMICRGVTWAR